MKLPPRLPFLHAATLAALMGAVPVDAQTTVTVAQPAQFAPAIFVDTTTGESRSSDPRFDLEFGGGPVRGFVDAVSQAVGRPINVILNPELADTEIPPMKLRQVTVPQLFDAVAAASQKQTLQSNYGTPPVPPGYAVPQTFSPSRYLHGFRTTDRPASTDSVWVFFREDSPKPPPPPPPPPVPTPPQDVRVLNLTPFLEGRSVEDITTAIRTACDMLEGVAPPKLTFHKETNLLISRGTPVQLEIIEKILRELAAAPPPVSRSRNTQFQMSPELMKRYGLTPPNSLPLESAPKKE